MTHKEVLEKAEKMLKEKNELTEVFEWSKKHNSKPLYMVPSKCNVHLIMESEDPEEYMWLRPHAIYLEDLDKVVLAKKSTYNANTDIFTYIDYETGEKKDIKVISMEKIYYRNYNLYTMKNGEIVRIQSLYNDDCVEDRDLEEIKDRIVKDYQNSKFCGECNKELSDDDKYCPHCGTKRGEGKFLPFLNETLYVYGPAIAYYYKCNNCKHKWRTFVHGGDKNFFCPKCGASNINQTKSVPGYNMLTEPPKDYSLINMLIYKIKFRIEMFNWNRKYKKLQINENEKKYNN